MVLVECSPVLSVTDSLVVSRFDDATPVVVDSRFTAGETVRRTLQMLDQARSPILGVGFKVTPMGGAYGYGYGYTYASDVPKRALRRPTTVSTSR